jgi:hypothetical protein
VTVQSRFHCFLTAVRFIPVSVFNFSKMITLGLVTFSWLCFQMDMDNYPHVTIAVDGSLCSTGQHRPGFPRVLYDALRQPGYNGDAPVYRSHMSMAHGQDKCEVNVVIPLNPMEPWMAIVIGVELDETVEQTAQVALTSLCESRLADTAAMPITLFPICNQEDHVWKQCLKAVSNPKGPHFHDGMAALAGYVQHLFNLQASTGRTFMRQHLHSSSLEQHVEELRCANAILHSDTPPPSDQDRELQVMYRHHNEAEHGWHYFRQQLDADREMLDERTHVIIHLEHHVKQQDLELEERAMMIADLEQ